MPTFFPRQTIEIRFEEPKAFRKFSFSLVEMAIVTGVLLRIYRLFVLTVAQIVEMFGVENCPPDINSLWRTKGSALETERIIAHAIEPNFPLAGVGDSDIVVVPGGYPWREIYWVYGGANDRPLSVEVVR